MRRPCSATCCGSRTNAWFNLGALHQQSGDYGAAVAAFRQALDSGHAEFAPKAAVNLGFVLFNHVGDVAGAEQAFRAAVASGHPEQAQLATMNLASMRQLVAQGISPDDAVDDPTDVATGRPTRFKLRLWRRRK